MKWVRLALVLEARDLQEAERFTQQLIRINNGCNDIWRKSMREMTDSEIHAFFGKSKDRMEERDYE